MAYFSRLTDIVTCSLSGLLEKAADPQQALEEIIHEMKEGVAGAQRSARTASENVARLESEIGEQRQQVENWLTQARDALAAGSDVNARRSLQRKLEIEDLIAGLQQQLEAAVTTRDHLRTTYNALQARLSDALRRRQEMQPADTSEITASDSLTLPPKTTARQTRLEQEMENLKRQLGSK